MRFVFLHGGPGFNSFAEQAILAPMFQAEGHDIVFWNEPSRLRPEGEPFEAIGAFERWMVSAERYMLRSAGSTQVHLIAHSFTPHAAIEIGRRHPDRLRSLILVGPAIDAFATYRNVLMLAHEDLADAKPEIASAIAECLAHTRAVLDDAMREGMMNALHDQRLFTHYFANADQLRTTLAARAHPQAQFDVESFFAVLGDFGERGASILSTASVTVPTLALFGAQDRITPLDEQRDAIRAAIPGCQMRTLDGCSHYVHLDRPRVFVDIVIEWAASLPLPPRLD